LCFWTLFMTSWTTISFLKKTLLPVFLICLSYSRHQYDASRSQKYRR